MFECGFGGADSLLSSLVPEYICYALLLNPRWKGGGGCAERYSFGT